MDYFDHSTCEEKVSISSTRLKYKNFTFRVLDISIKISHVEYSKVDLVSGRSKLILLSTEKKYLKSPNDEGGQRYK